MRPVLKLSVVCLVLAVAALTTQLAEAFLDHCFDTWSRCSKWSDALTGLPVIGWLTCHDRCRELGYRTGDCVLTRSKCSLATEAYQCQCSN